MPTERTAALYKDISEAYAGGQTIAELVRKFARCRGHICKILHISGHVLRFKKLSDSANADIITAYVRGASSGELSRQYSVSRERIHTIVTKAGVARSFTEEMRRRASCLTEERRAAMAALMRKRMKGCTLSPEHQHRVAIDRQRSLRLAGRGENALAKALFKKGIKTIAQLAFDTYNIDLAAGSVAVEVTFNYSASVGSPRTKRRVKHLIKSGWHVIYVMIDTRGKNNRWDVEATANTVSRFINLTKRHPPALREYWVIGGTGKLKSVLKLNVDHLTGVVTARDGFRVS